MNFWISTTKVFAFFLLFFVSFVSANAQTETSIYQLSSGTKIRVKMDNEINSKVSSEKDTFTAIIVESATQRQAALLPPGTVFEGVVTKVKRAALNGKHGKLIVLFNLMRLPNGEKRKIEGVLNNELEAESTTTAKILTIAGGTALGTVLGASSKANKGALIGAGIGFGAGTGIVFLRKGKEVGIKSDEEFEIKLTKDVTLPIEDF
ncbi:MAG: hypothetical protein H0T08_00285 [Acidobacteria bacterium]|jgi:hypothetical protein|nr:hypothetical protein [Acidobacteriota bacterium]